MKVIIFWFLAFFTYAHIPLYTIDNPHFYRALFFWGEPRFEKPWLSTLEVAISGGKTRHSYNAEGVKSSLLNIYGSQNMQALGENVPLNPANPLDAILLNLQALPQRSTFGQLLYKGTFICREGIINAYQNFCNGFFAQLYLPIRHLAIKKISFVDLSPDDMIEPNKNTPTWQTFLANMPTILERFSLTTQPFDKTGIGDLTLLGGWTLNYQDTIFLDYVDVDAKIGILFPTAAARDINNPFSLPLGYNRHYGVPLKFDLSFGAWDWFTWGFHLGALFFFERKVNMRIKTSLEQNGLIKLAQANINTEPGSIWDVSTYIKADHFMRGLSFLVGYSFNQQDAFCFTANNNAYSTSILLTDELFKQWRMHTLHALVEYDFTQSPCGVGPRIGLLYNYVIDGKRIFDTSLLGGYVGIDIAWGF